MSRSASHRPPTPAAWPAGAVPIATGTAELRRERDDPDGVTLLVNGVPSSHLDLVDPTRLEFEYMQQMAAIAARMPAGPLSAVHLGAAGCASAAFDTRAAADALAVHAGVLLDGSVDLHVSGCPKGCAHPAKAAVTLCGTAAGIGLVLDGRAGDPPATHLPADGLKPAIERLGSFLQSSRGEKETAQSLLERTAPAALVSAFQGQQ